MKHHPAFYEMALLNTKVKLWRAGHRLSEINDVIALSKDAVPTIVDTTIPADAKIPGDTVEGVAGDGILANIIKALQDFFATDLGKMIEQMLIDLLTNLFK